MNRIKTFATRLHIIILLLVVQAVLIAFLAGLIFARIPFIAYVGIGISVLAVLFILKSEKASAYKITWLILVLAAPAIGGTLYLLLGNRRPTKKIAAHAAEHALIADLLDQDGNLPFINKIQCGRMFSLMQYIRSSSAYHAYKHTETSYYRFGEAMFEDMLRALEQAERFIFMEYFIIKESKMWDKLLDVMTRKAAEGVDVRLLVDDLGSCKLFTKKYVARLNAQGIKVMRFNPMLPLLLLFMNNRDHRKITIIDGHTAFNGGINIADEYINKNSPFGVWKDTGVRLRGDAVWSFTLMFIEMWDTFCKKEERIDNHLSYKPPADETLVTDGFVLPYGDTPLGHERVGENVYVDMLHQAEQYVYIFTPYLIISEKMINALQMTARRGVDVRLITPGIPDKKIIHRLARSYYSCLLDAGVKIYEYTPGFLHAKSFVCDDKLAVVGTINLDYRSLYLHFECATLLYQSSVIQDIRDDALQTITESREITPDHKRRRIWTDLFDAILHLFSPLL